MTASRGHIETFIRSFDYNATEKILHVYAATKPNMNSNQPTKREHVRWLARNGLARKRQRIEIIKRECLYAYNVFTNDQSQRTDRKITLHHQSLGLARDQVARLAQPLCFRLHYHHPRHARYRSHRHWQPHVRPRVHTNAHHPDFVR